MEIKVKFTIVYLEEVIDFLNGLDVKAKSKIAYNLDRCRYVMDKELFKKLDGTDIWEFRTLYNGIQYRLLAFWDNDKATIVVATHGFIKKTQKTPSKEIAKAEEIKKKYFKLKR